jgi:hypothetical protein
MKKKVGTLLAVTLATAPALAGPKDAPLARQVEATRPDPWAAPKPGPTFPANMPDSFRRLQNQLVIDGVFAALGIATPRVLRSGAPACGNVQTKGPRPAHCEEDE